MGLKVRYWVVGVGLVLFLVGLVASVKWIRGHQAFASIENMKVKGPKDAPIHLVIYSDFQCPACRAALVPVEELRKEFADLLRVEFRYYPLERPHRWALIAAAFAECAAEQGKFWEFHDRLFQEQPIWSKSEDAIPFFARYSIDLNLDRRKFETCLANPKTMARVRLEHSMGDRSKVQSTPTFFMNGKILVGALQLSSEGKRIILEELKK